MDFLPDFEFYMPVLGFRRGPIGFIAPSSFKWLDSQPEKSNMGPVPTDFHDFLTFQKSQDGFLTRYLSCFRAGASQFAFSRFSVETKKNRDEKLRRFVVVSPREVPSLPVSCLFKILICLSFLKAPHHFLSQPSRKKCTLIISVNRRMDHSMSNIYNPIQGLQQ